jgi:orotidine 5'-phosphate decarboxylase subfamily 2
MSTGENHMARKPFLQKLSESYAERETVLCFGMDPVIERMPIDTSRPLSDEIVRYFSTILRAVAHRISAIKPNVGFYLQYGKEGLEALDRLIRTAQEQGLPVILDLKAGDIGRTSAAYARFAFQELGADAVTLNPYMGYDAIEPFVQYGDRGFYILALTSNPGAAEFQQMRLGSEKPLYAHVLEHLCTWSEHLPSIGAVLGATQREFAACIDYILQRGLAMPLLIPGVGAQGGSLRDIQGVLIDKRYPIESVRINASSSISYAREKYPDLPLEEAALRAVEELTAC